MDNKDRRLRILLNTNSPHTNSGYGRWAGDFTKRALADGWNVAINAFVGLEGQPRMIDGVLTYPRLADQWGSDGIVLNGNHYGAHVVIHFADSWVLNPQYLQQLAQTGRKLIYYVPIDQEPISPSIINNLRFAYKIITFSKYGQKALQRSGFSSKLIVEGTDTTVFKPLDKIQCRKELNLPPDAFIIGQIGANKENPPRKGWQQSLEAFALFSKKHDDAIFFYHSNQNMPTGFPIMHYAQYLGIEKKIFHLDEYLSTIHAGSTEINKLLNAFDVLSHASLTEGFGLIIIEAQAAGCPVIVGESQSQPELIIPDETGFVCKTAFKWLSNAGGFYHFPDANHLYELYEKAYRADRKEMGRKGREYIINNYDINSIYEKQWNPLLASLQTEILGDVKT